MSELTREELNEFLGQFIDPASGLSDHFREKMKAIHSMALASLTAHERGFAEAIEKAVEVVTEHYKIVPNHDPEAMGEDLVAQGYGNCCVNLAAALRALSPSHDTVRVPREPTEAMLRAGHHMVNGTPPIAGVKALIKSIWRAMIAEVK